MRRIITLVCVFTLLAQMATAQHNLYVISKTGEITAYNAKGVFFDLSEQLTINCALTSVTKSTLEGILTIEPNEASGIKGISQVSSTAGYEEQPDTEIGICYSDCKDTPTYYDGRIKISDSFGAHDFVINKLDEGTTYNYRPFIRTFGCITYGAVKKVSTLGSKLTNREYVIIDGHKFVDFHLPSGNLWAVNNIGAGAEADFGLYFAWGETESKPSYEGSNYKHSNGSETEMIKYNDVDGKTTLEPEDDPASVLWGPSFHTPTYEDFLELSQCEGLVWEEEQRMRSDGSYVLVVCAYLRNHSKAQIYFPATGQKVRKTVHGDNRDYKYWTSTRVSDDNKPWRAYIQSLYNRMGNVGGLDDEMRFVGMPIRPITKK